MTIKEMVDNHEICDEIWHNKKKGWVNSETEGDIQYAIVYGDDGGDTFITEFTSEEDFNKGLHSHIIEGNTGCDFDTAVYLIVKNGEKYTPTIK